MWGRQESHNKRSCRTANGNILRLQGEDSDTKVKPEEVLEAIIVEDLVQGVIVENVERHNRQDKFLKRRGHRYAGRS